MFPYTTIRPFENFIRFLAARLSVCPGLVWPVASLLPPAIERNLWTSKNSSNAYSCWRAEFRYNDGWFHQNLRKTKKRQTQTVVVLISEILTNFFLYIWRRRQLFSLCMWSTWECVCGFLPSWCGGWNLHCVRVRNLRVFYADVICNIWKFSLQNTLNKKIENFGTRLGVGKELV